MINPVGGMLERNSAYGAILNNCNGIFSISTIRSKAFKDFPGQLSCFALEPGRNWHTAYTGAQDSIVCGSGTGQVLPLERPGAAAWAFRAGPGSGSNTAGRLTRRAESLEADLARQGTVL